MTIPAQRSRSVMASDVARFINGQEKAEIVEFCGRCIDDAVRELNLRRWCWTLKEATVTLASGSATFALPTDFLYPRALSLNNASTQAVVRIPYMEPKEFLDTFTDRSQTGTPTCYTVIDPFQSAFGRFNVMMSSSAFATYPTGSLTYFLSLDVPSGQGQVTTIPPQVESWIMWRAREIAGLTYAPRDGESAGVQARRLWTSLVAMDNFQTDWS